MAGSPKALLTHLPSVVHSSYYRSDCQWDQFISQLRSLLGEWGKGSCACQEAWR